MTADVIPGVVRCGHEESEKRFEDDDENEDDYDSLGGNRALLAAV